MPYFSIETSQAITDSGMPDFIQATSAFIADLLKKPEFYVMISVKTNAEMIFGGTGRPTAFVRLKSLGLQQDKTGEYAEKICNFLEKNLNVPKDRIFIEFKDLQRNMFGWNGKTF